MSSISAQGVVERASAELSKRINGLGLRSKSSSHHNNNSSSAGSGGGVSSGGGGGANNSSSTGASGTVSTSGSSGKTSVMERVTNALCGGGNHSHQQQQTNSNATSGGVHAPEKPSRLSSGSGGGSAGTGKSHLSSMLSNNKANATTGTLQMIASSTPQSLRKHHHAQPALPAPPLPTTIQQLMLDDRFLNQFFLYFSSLDRCNLAQVCTKWHDVLYRSPRYWSGLVPVVQARELRMSASQDRIKLYNSLIRRGFHSISLLGATDDDALDIVHSFPLASKHIHSLSLRCSSVSDRGLEALLDHLQVSGPVCG